MKRLALATWEGLPYLVPDDQEFRLQLLQADIEATPVVWSRPDVRWEQFDAVLIRSTWDYYRRAPEFRAWVERVGRATRLWNPPELVKWNSNKAYLLDLEARGLPIIPTVVLDGPGTLEPALREHRWMKAVLKPAISGAAYRTYRVHPGQEKENEAHLAEILTSSKALLQPYLSEVEREGEHSLVFLGGKYSHAIVKSPFFEGRTPIQEGSPIVPREEELVLARRTLEAVPQEKMYARVDMVRDDHGLPRIMELEVIEPSLFFLSAPGSALRFAEQIRAVL